MLYSLRSFREVSWAGIGQHLVITDVRRDGSTPYVPGHAFASVDLGFSGLVAAERGHAAYCVTQRYVHILEALGVAAERMAGKNARLLDDGGPTRDREAPASTATIDLLVVTG